MAAEFGVSFSDKFRISPNWMKAKGIFDPTLDVDSPLFIDPFLLSYSEHKEFSECGFEAYEQHFTEIYGLLRLCETTGDKAWQGALKKFQFSETHGLGGTCLGYSKTTKGRGFGKVLSARALGWARQVVALGVKDPEFFSALSLFEDGIGPDLISDMVTNIILKCIVAFNDRVYSDIEKELGVKIARKDCRLRDIPCSLPLNPYLKDGTPVILLADDVLKHLPIVAENAVEIRHVAEQNAELRDRVNSHISEIFKIQTKKDKEATWARAMKDAAAFQTFLDLLKIIEKQPYDIYKDPEGLIQWRAVAQMAVAAFSLKIADDKSKSRGDRLESIVGQIIEQFRSLIEDNRLSESLYVDHEPRHERFAQLTFFAIAKSYCDANDIDVSPEADAGVGPVDFKFSDGGDKVVVEIKLSTNQKVVEGYTKQLEAYKTAERTHRGHYVVIDVGKMGKKWETLQKIVAAEPDFGKIARVHIIDGSLKPSASKR